MAKMNNTDIQKDPERAIRGPSSCPLNAVNNRPGALDTQSIVFPEKGARLTGLLTCLKVYKKSNLLQTKEMQNEGN